MAKEKEGEEVSTFQGFTTWSGKRYVIGERVGGRVITQIIETDFGTWEVWAGCELVDSGPKHRIAATHYTPHFDCPPTAPLPARR